MGLRTSKFDRFLPHAIDQEFFALDIGWIMNLDRWNSLSPKAQKLIQDTVIAFEVRNETMLSKMAAEEKQTLINGGMQFHKVPNRVHFRRMAVNSLYEELEHVSETENRDTNQHAKLRKAFQ